VLFAKL